LNLATKYHVDETSQYEQQPAFADTTTLYQSANLKSRVAAADACIDVIDLSHHLL